jgi:hypothetical protein
MPYFQIAYFIGDARALLKAIELYHLQASVALGIIRCCRTRSMTPRDTFPQFLCRPQPDKENLWRAAEFSMSVSRVIQDLSVPAG